MKFIPAFPVVVTSTVFLAVATLAGCSRSNDYTPAANASGEEIFKAACVSCHQSKGTHTFEMANADAAAISKRIAEGNMMMPKFPNIQGQALNDLVAYVQAQNKAK